MIKTYKIDPAHSSANFSVRHMMISNVRGAFSSVQGTVAFDPENPAATTIDAVIDTNSISTNEPQRDAHLKSPDFFHAEQHPAITFKSKSARAKGESEIDVTGDLTIHGVTKEVVLDVEGPTPEGKDPWGNTRMGASAKTKIKRSDFGLQWNAALETGGVLVGDDVKIDLEVSLIRSDATAA